MAPRFPFSGGVRSHALSFSKLLPISICVRVGNGIQLSGIVAGSITYDLQLDGSTNSSISPSTSGSILLAEYEGLQPGNHTLSLIVHNPTNSTSALIAIDRALITINSTSPKYVPRRPLPLYSRALRILRILTIPALVPPSLTLLLTILRSHSRASGHS